MVSRHAVAGALLSLGLWACSESPTGTWNEMPTVTTTTQFSPTVAPLPTLLAPRYGDRFGPGINLWADGHVLSTVPKVRGPAIAGVPSMGATGPDLLLGSVAVFTDSTNTTIAYDLDAKAEKWRLASPFARGQFTTDGTVICGVALTSSTNDTTLQCVNFATGAVLWTRVVPRWLFPAQGQNYGMNAQLAIHGTRFYVAGGVASGGAVESYVLTDGTVSWTLAARPHSRGMVFIGSDLVLDGVKDGCATGPSCLRAINPDTGAKVAEFAAETASHLWSTGNLAVFMTPTTGSARSTVQYDATSHAFTENAALGASFDKAMLTSSQVLVGVSPVQTNQRVYLAAIDGTAQGNPTNTTTICRYNVTARATDWCQTANGSLSNVRVHPNAIFCGGSTGTTVMPPAAGETVPSVATGWYFGRWIFSTEGVYAYR